ncbi:MAG TPA: carboxypeptidase-like regulatory domain-containing protein [Blastocatellia bacterium]|nr:carboxypeptidase-like regulatory domain-containing protein [Blastocatellia bacterium]
MAATVKKLKKYGGAAVIVLLFFLTPAAAFGQSEAGQITGKVTDTAGAAIAGAKVSVKSVDTGGVRDKTTDPEGFYTVASLQPGLYEITVQDQGFANRTQRVQVTIGAIRRVETQLSVTPVTGEEKVLGGGGVEVNTQNTQLADPVSNRQLRELPTVTRDPYDLISLSGNVTGTGTASAGGRRDPAYAINGQRPTANNVQLDGGENVTNYTTSLGQRIPLDGVQEMQVVTTRSRRSPGSITTSATAARFMGGTRSRIVTFTRAPSPSARTAASTRAAASATTTRS